MNYVFSKALYTQLTLLVAGFLVSLFIPFFLKRILTYINKSSSECRKNKPIQLLSSGSVYLVLFIFLIFLSLGETLLGLTPPNNYLINIGQVGAALIVINYFLKSHIGNTLQLNFIRAILLPFTFLLLMGWLDDISKFLETFSFSIGNIKFKLNGLLKIFIFGSLLFWLGKVSNSKGKNLIRGQKNLDSKTKEIFIKIFELSIYVIFIIIMLEISGVDLTTLALFAGAVGVGLGLGLQSIASNFISGIIILLDRSISVGDHIELEDGKKGVLRQLNMRSATIQTYDGKDILVPNEKFITNAFVNWTHEHDKQRYSIELQVSYKTDLHKLFDIIRKTVASHSQVLSGDSIPFEEQPDAEISSFGESGVNILIEYWIQGIDDGKNRVGADLLLMLWDVFQENNIEIPYPQLQITVLNASKKT